MSSLLVIIVGRALLGPAGVPLCCEVGPTPVGAVVRPRGALCLRAGLPCRRTLPGHKMWCFDRYAPPRNHNELCLPDRTGNYTTVVTTLSTTRRRNPETHPREPDGAPDDGPRCRVTGPEPLGSKPLERDPGARSSVHDTAVDRSAHPRNAPLWIGSGQVKKGCGEPRNPVENPPRFVDGRRSVVARR